ncbi:MAG: sugar transferase [Elusimicrobia bacterium]|nr:sugar transferase [Elusimicrobiota bacterium]
MVRPLSKLWFVRTLVPVFGDLAILFGSLGLSFYLREPLLLRAHVFLGFAPLFALWCGTFYVSGLYNLRQVRDFVALIGGLLASGILCWVLGTTYFYLFSPYLELTPKTHLALTVALSHLLMLAWRRTILLATDFSLLKLRLLVLAGEPHLEHLRQTMGTRHDGSLDLAERFGPDVDLVVADGEWIEAHWDEARRVFSAAVARHTAVVSLDSFYESLFGKVSPAFASDPAWALEHVLPRADSLYFRGKRLFDACAAAAGLVVLSPVFVLAALGICCIDGMSPLYGQARIGYLGRSFMLWKFRTMRPGADADGPFRADRESAARVTPLGAFLRRFRFDEFPQLWNVLRGDMSLVGPRPEWIKEVEVLEKVVPHYHLRHLVPPGITGWAQVYYRATNDPQESIEKHHYDLYYLKNFSPALDLTILLKTIKRIFVRDAGVSSVHTPFPRSMRMTPLPVDISSIISRN